MQSDWQYYCTMKFVTALISFMILAPKPKRSLSESKNEKCGGWSKIVWESKEREKEKGYKMGSRDKEKQIDWLKQKLEEIMTIRKHTDKRK